MYVCVRAFTVWLEKDLLFVRWGPHDSAFCREDFAAQMVLLVRVYYKQKNYEPDC